MRLIPDITQHNIQHHSSMTSSNGDVFRVTVLGIHWSLDCPHKGIVTRTFYVSVVNLNKLLIKHSIGRWFETQWRSFDVTVMLSRESNNHSPILHHMNSMQQNVSCLKCCLGSLTTISTQLLLPWALHCLFTRYLSDSCMQQTRLFLHPFIEHSHFNKLLFNAIPLFYTYPRFL